MDFSPEAIKTIGFWVLVAGLAGDIFVLFMPARKRRLEKILGVVFTLVVIAGVVIEKIGDNRLAELVGPRRLKPEQSEQLVSALSRDPQHLVIIVSAMFDPESNDFADALISPINNGNWTAFARIRNWARAEYGVTIGRVDSEALPGEKTLDSALTAAHVVHNIKQIVGSDAQSMTPHATAGNLYLFVGHKPPASH